MGYSYADYCAEFGKASNGASREAIFNDNMATILSQNAIPDKTWFATVNEFTDWTNDEFRAYVKGTNRQRLFDGWSKARRGTCFGWVFVCWLLCRFWKSLQRCKP